MSYGIKDLSYKLDLLHLSEGRRKLGVPSQSEKPSTTSP